MLQCKTGLRYITFEILHEMCFSSCRPLTITLNEPLSQNKRCSCVIRISFWKYETIAYSSHRCTTTVAPCMFASHWWRRTRPTNLTRMNWSEKTANMATTRQTCRREEYTGRLGCERVANVWQKHLARKRNWRKWCSNGFVLCGRWRVFWRVHLVDSFITSLQMCQTLTEHTTYRNAVQYRILLDNHTCHCYK